MRQGMFSGMAMALAASAASLVLPVDGDRQPRPESSKGPDRRKAGEYRSKPDDKRDTYKRHRRV